MLLQSYAKVLCFSQRDGPKSEFAGRASVKTGGLNEKERASSNYLQDFEMKYLAHVALLDEVFCNLHSIEGCSLAYLVAHKPEAEAARIAQVGTYAAYIDVVFAC